MEKKVEILDGVDMDKAPALKGYVRFEAKPAAETILTVNAGDPLLVRWQYGLGRSAVFTSDAKSRWAANWVSWSGFGKFWANLARDLLPHAQSGEAKVHYDSADGQLVVDYRLARYVPEPATVPDIFVFGPDGFEQPVEVKKVAEGAYRGTVPIANRQGLFRIRPLETSRAFPETGLYLPEKEVTEYGSNELLLKQIAEFTGGRFNPTPEQVFEGTGKSIPSVVELWPALLALAILLNLAELVNRKWKGLRERFARPAPASA